MRISFNGATTAAASAKVKISLCFVINAEGV
jgi:hypothetical protein